MTPAPSMFKRQPARAASLLILGLGLACVAAGAEQQKIRLATLAPRGSSYHRALLAMGEKWRQETGGGVALTVFPDGSMGGESDAVRRMRVGQLQAAMLTVTGLSDIDDSVKALQNIPLLFRTLDEADYVRERLRPLLDKKFLDKGFVVLFWGDAGWVRFFSKEPVLRPVDLKRQKLFTWAGDAPYAEVMKGAGLQPVVLETADILPSLQTGLITTAPMPPFYALAGQFYTCAPHMLELNWAPLVGGAVITRKAWDALPAESRQRLRESAAEAGRLIETASRAETEAAVAAMVKRGLVVHRLTPEVEAEWRKLVEDSYPKLRGALGSGEVFDEVRRLLAEYRKERKSKG